MKPMLIFLCCTILFCCSNVKHDNNRITSIGYSLVRSDSLYIEEIVYIGPGLQDKIDSLRLDTTNYTIKAREGDIKMPFGNNEADHTLEISTKKGGVQIRLIENKTLDKYDVLGWMSM